MSIMAQTASVVQECQLFIAHSICAEIDEAIGVGRSCAGATPEHTAAPLVVIGDSLLDRDLVGQVRRLSPEAPVPAVDEVETLTRPGGAGLAAVLATAHDRPVTLITALANDRDGRELAALLREQDVHVIDLGLRGPTPIRMRIRNADQSLLMVSNSPRTRGALMRPLSGAEHELVRQAGAIVVSDYAEGICRDGSVRAAVASVVDTVPVVWDPHERGAEPVAGVRLVTPNADEADRLSGSIGGGGLMDEIDRAQALLRKWRSTAVVLTRGRFGAVLIDRDNGSPQVVPTLDDHGGDSCGAGDRFAVEAASLLAGRTLMSEAVAQGVRAATEYVTGGGAAVLTTSGNPVPAKSDQHHACAQVERVRTRGGTVVATGGCFDVLHTGHVRFLEQARGLGDCLVVCLNDDESIRRLKGPSRPVTPMEDRICVLRSLASVDDIEVFSEDTPIEALRRVKPDIYVKGGDYRLEDIVEAELVAGWGGRTVILPYIRGRSTSQLITSLESVLDESSGKWLEAERRDS